MKLGVFGGTFDPVHYGHLLIAEIARDALRLDQVLFVLAGDPPHKRNSHKTDVRHRKKMVELAIATNPKFKLCTVDLDRPGPHYSVDTVRLIRAKTGVSAEDCFFVVGGDSLVDLPVWHQPKKLVGACRLAAIHRPGYQPNTHALEKKIPGLKVHVKWVAAPAVDLSSSQIRGRVAKGQTVRYQVPEPVRQYIAQQGLYLPGNRAGQE